MFSLVSRTIVASLAVSALLTSTALAQGTATPASPSLGGPKLIIAAPQDNQTFYGDKVPVLLSVENFNLVDYQTNKTKINGQGHIHLWLDDPNPTRESAVKISQDNFTYSDVPYGTHKLTAELVASDHSSLRPPVTATVNFKTAPISSPSPIAASGFDKNTALVILVVVALVILAAWWYTKEEDEEISKDSKVTKVSKGTETKSKRRRR